MADGRTPLCGLPHADRTTDLPAGGPAGRSVVRYEAPDREHLSVQRPLEAASSGTRGYRGPTPGETRRRHRNLLTHAWAVVFPIDGIDELVS